MVFGDLELDEIADIFDLLNGASLPIRELILKLRNYLVKSEHPHTSMLILVLQITIHLLPFLEALLESYFEFIQTIFEFVGDLLRPRN